MRHTEVDERAGCWICDLRPGSTYGMITNSETTTLAHRIVYAALVGPIPSDYVLDHLCRRRRCVNPAHLEPTTIGDNVLRGEGTAARHARQTDCVHGHPLAGDNVYVWRGERKCRMCMAVVQRRQALRRASIRSAVKVCG